MWISFGKVESFIVAYFCSHSVCKQSSLHSLSILSPLTYTFSGRTFQFISNRCQNSVVRVAPTAIAPSLYSTIFPGELFMHTCVALYFFYVCILIILSTSNFKECTCTSPELVTEHSWLSIHRVGGELKNGYRRASSVLTYNKHIAS